MNNFLKFNALLTIVVMLSGCVSLTVPEQNALYELKAYGVSWEERNLVKPKSAALLSLLPGGGYYYMASNVAEYYPNLWWAAIFNTVTFPLSWFWGVPMSYADAANINKKELVRFNQYDPAGQEQLKALRKKYRTVELGLNEVDYNDGRVRAS
jgi:hypothetical protein